MDVNNDGAKYSGKVSPGWQVSLSAFSDNKHTILRSNLYFLKKNGNKGDVIPVFSNEFLNIRIFWKWPDWMPCMCLATTLVKNTLAVTLYFWSRFWKTHRRFQTIENTARTWQIHYIPAMQVLFQKLWPLQLRINVFDPRFIKYGFLTSLTHSFSRFHIPVFTQTIAPIFFKPDKH